jgi:dihydroxyacetone kinase
MIGVLMHHPRDCIISNLNEQLDQYFVAGKKVEQVAPGVSGEREAVFGTSHVSKLRAERDKLAPGLKELATIGKTVIQAATEMGMATKRARLIARENRITFPGPP